MKLFELSESPRISPTVRFQASKQAGSDVHRCYFVLYAEILHFDSFIGLPLVAFLYCIDSGYGEKKVLLYCCCCMCAFWKQLEPVKVGKILQAASRIPIELSFKRATFPHFQSMAV